MHKCEHYPNLVILSNFPELESSKRFFLTDEEIEHLQQVAALQRESRLQRSAHSDLCQSDLDTECYVSCDGCNELTPSEVIDSDGYCPDCNIKWELD